MSDIKTLCKEQFLTHKATLIQDTERFLIIDWRRADGSGNYYVNYIVDKKRGSLIVSGDLGDSIATWYNPLTAEKIKSYIHNDVGYYIGKLQCASDKYYYDEENIVSDLKDYLQDCDEYELINAYNKYTYCSVDSMAELWETLKNDISGCIFGNTFIPNSDIQNFCRELNEDYWEWLYSCGRRIHTRVYLWAEGFYMACEQLGI